MKNALYKCNSLSLSLWNKPKKAQQEQKKYPKKTQQSLAYDRYFCLSFA
jgi:hypothetical protein